MRGRLFSRPRTLYNGDNMKTKRIFLRPNLLTIFLALLLLQACAPTPTPFVPPRAPTPTQALIQGNTPVIPTFTPTPIVIPSPTTTPPCTDGLAFIKDLTFPDGAIVEPGSGVDKQWQVQNNGSCNWDSRYRLKFVGGLDMGAAAEQALYPARAGTQTVIHITFIAPEEPGTYSTAWQAFDPNGEPFGEAVFMEIIILPEIQITLEVVE